MRRLLWMVMALLVISSIIVACAAPASTPAPAPTPAPTPAPAPTPPTTYTLTFAHHLPANHFLTTDVVEVFIKDVEAKSNGRIKIKHLPGATVVQSTATYDALKTGITDFAWASAVFLPTQMSLAAVVFALPMAYPNATKGSLAAAKLYESLPAMTEFEFTKNDLVRLGSSVTAPYAIAASKDINRLADLKGLKIRTPGGAITPVLEAVGTVPITLPPGDIYSAMERKTIDGVALAASAMSQYGIEKLLKSDLADPVFPGVGNSLAMSKKAFDALPADLRTILMDAGKKKPELVGKAYDSREDATIESLKKAGVKMVKLPPEDLTALRNLLKPFWEKGLQDMKKAAGDAFAVEVMNKWKAVLKEAGIQPPD